MFELSTNVASPQRLRRGDYSAYDALYLGDFSCPDYPENYCADPELLADAAAAVAALGKKCYLRLHAVPSNHELPQVRQMIEAAMPLQFDAFEVHNLGVLQMLREMGCTKPDEARVCGLCRGSGMTSLNAECRGCKGTGRIEVRTVEQQKCLKCNATGRFPIPEEI